MFCGFTNFRDVAHVGECKDYSKKCGANPGWPLSWCVDDRPYVLEDCPLFCGNCGQYLHYACFLEMSCNQSAPADSTPYVLVILSANIRWYLFSCVCWSLCVRMRHIVQTISALAISRTFTHTNYCCTTRLMHLVELHLNISTAIPNMIIT